jgi:hypothetical protein
MNDQTVLKGGSIQIESQTHMNLFEKLIFNDCIFQQIQDFIRYTDTNKLLNASSRFKMIKKSKYYWKLNKEYSLKYYKNGEFRTRLNSLLVRSVRQLSLNLMFCRDVKVWIGLGLGLGLGFTDVGLNVKNKFWTFILMEPQL